MDEEPPNYVAKIYDAAYYNDADGFSGDVSLAADMDYTYEVAAYEHLSREGANGLYTPKYYGSWTMNMPVPPDPNDPERPVTRAVRLIVIEYFPGTNMYALLASGRVDTMPIPQRLEFMAKAMECLCQLEFLGISHADFEPRNVIVLDAALARCSTTATHAPETDKTENAVKTEQPEKTAETDQAKTDEPSLAPVRIIDFNFSFLYNSHYMLDKFRRKRAEMASSPLHRFWSNSLFEFAAWIPHIYHMRVPAFNGWLKHRWGSTAGRCRVPSDDERRHRRMHATTEYIPPESISLPEIPIPGRTVYFLEAEDSSSASSG